MRTPLPCSSWHSFWKSCVRAAAWRLSLPPMLQVLGKGCYLLIVTEGCALEDVSVIRVSTRRWPGALGARGVAIV